MCFQHVKKKGGAETEVVTMFLFDLFWENRLEGLMHDVCYIGGATDYNKLK